MKSFAGQLEAAGFGPGGDKKTVFAGATEALVD
jgi:hypothetical protein